MTRRPLYSLSRRGLLRGALGTAGTALALPLLDSLVPREARAAAAVLPKRLLFYYVPCGIHMDGWRPKSEGAGYDMTPILKPLEALRADFHVISGLANDPARPDGAGDHASGTGSFLTCAHPKKTGGADIQNGISADQVAAQKMGDKTKFASLQLGTDGSPIAGDCDSGYSCAYLTNISWASATTPLPKLTNPQTIFDRLFAGPDGTLSQAEQEKRKRYKKSVLDFASADVAGLQPKLGKTDRRKLDEYLAGVRDLEKRVGAASGPVCAPGTRPAKASLPLPEHVKALSDLVALAFQCDLTRIVTLMVGNGASGKSFPFLGVQGGHHELSHHQKNPANLAALQTINMWEVEQLGYLLDKMKKATEGEGSNVLYNSATFFSSEISDGDRHNHDDYPVLLAGHGGGAWKPGRHIVFPTEKRTKVANLFVSMLRSVDVDGAVVGDSTGALGGL